MGVHGLWKLLEPSGKPVPVETLEQHVLAVDVSIWLHQLLQGYRDTGGSSLPNAHLLGLFHRVCKLLFFRIKPVFVFDGGVPTLKKKTIAARHQQKDKATAASEKARQQLLKNLLKQKAVSQVLGELKAIPGTSASQEKKDLYELPPILDEDDNSDIESIPESYSSESEEDVKKKKYKDLHSIDVHNKEFKNLPADIRHDILSELKERRKENSWGRIHEMPEDLGHFSSFQMNRLLKRRSVQVSLEEAEKEMGGRTLSLGDVEALLTEQGIQTSSTVGNRIASDNVTRYLYVTDSAKASEKVVVPSETKENNDLISTQESDSKDNHPDDTSDGIKENKDKKVVLNSQDESKETSETVSFNKVKKESTESSIFDEIKIEESDNSSDEITFEELNEEFEMNRKLIIENSGLTQEQILSIIKEQNRKSNENVNRIGEIEQKFNDVERKIQNTCTESEQISFHDSNKEVKLEVDTSGDNPLLNINAENSQDEDLNVTDNQNVLICSQSESNSIITDSIFKISNYSIPNKVPRLSDSNICKDVIEPTSETVNISTSKNSIQAAGSITASSDSNSDDDEFIEVVKSSKNITAQPQIKPTDPTVLQVTINTKPGDNNNDEDLFADIFDDVASNGVVALDVKESLVDENNDVEIMSSSNSSSGENEDDIENNSFDSKPVTKDIVEDDCDSITEKSKICKYFGSAESESQMEVNDNSVERNSKAVSSDDSFGVENEQHLETIDENHQEPPKKLPKKLTNKELSKLQTILEQQEGELLQKQGKEERLASTVTEQMRIEAQELLQLFGVPWVTAPMEAEAQCAFLDLIGLTQGTITDDSDIWLFGARKVYKNFFNQKKFVLQFQAQDIQHYFKLSRGDLIELALLVGSDYTVGVTGVGPVTALEILAMFRPSSSNDSSVLNTLSAFKSWLQHPSNSGSPLARKLKDIRLEDGFPNKDVVDAYLHPLVDESEESFTWGFPDLAGLREFTKRKFGWSQARTDEILLPVVKNLSQKTSQSKIDSFFQMKPAIPVYKDKVSQRVQKAIYRLGGESSSTLGQFESVPGSSSQTQRQRRSRGGGQNKRSSGRGRGRGTVLEIEPPPPPKPLPFPTNEELIPQRERDRLEALKRKMEAIEVMKAKKGKNAKRRPPKAPIKKEANLSESSSDDN